MIKYLVTLGKQYTYARKLEIILDCCHYENKAQCKLNGIFFVIAEKKGGKFLTEMSLNVYQNYFYEDNIHNFANGFNGQLSGWRELISNFVFLVSQIFVFFISCLLFYI